MVKGLCFHCRGTRFSPWLGAADGTRHIVQPKKEKNRIKCGCIFMDLYVPNYGTLEHFLNSPL